MPKPHAGESRQDFVGRCMSSGEAQASFPSTDQRLAFCESSYDNRHSNSFVQSAKVKQSTCTARKVTFQGRPFRVVSAVLIRAQVLHNNLGSTYLPADEFTDDWAEQWNHIPVLVGPHPSERGVSASGRSPEIINERGVGWIFGAHVDTGPDGTRRLVGEVWLDESRAAVVAGFQAVLDSLDAGKNVELSTGFPTQSDDAPGVHNGETFELVLHPAGADHLVISTEMTGACAVADGCGLGANQEGTTMEADAGAAAAAAANDTPMQSVGGTPHPASDFAYVPDPQTPSTWKLPIFDAEHVRAALARFNQTDMQGDSRMHAWRKILAAADHHQVTIADRTMPAHQSAFKAMLARVVELFGKPQQAFSWEDHETRRLERTVAEMQLTPSDSERAQMLQEALQEAYGDNARDVIVCDVYTEPERYVVFWFMTPMGPQPKGQEYYRVLWAVDSNGDGKPEVKGTPELVRRQMTYEPVKDGSAVNAAEGGSPATAPAEQSNNQEGDMDATKETELTASVETLTKLVGQLATQVENLAKQSAPAEIMGLKATIGKLADRFDKMEGVTNAAIQERERERQHLVQSLAGNHRVPFTSAELEAKPVEELRRLAQMAEPTDFTGKGGPSGRMSAEQKFAEPVPYWKKQKEGE